MWNGPKHAAVRARPPAERLHQFSANWVALTKVCPVFVA
jgi:hypothetical protein